MWERNLPEALTIAVEACALLFVSHLLDWMLRKLQVTQNEGLYMKL